MLGERQLPGPDVHDVVLHHDRHPRRPHDRRGGHPGRARLQGEAGRVQRRSTTRPWRMGGLYWHFVDIVWVFLVPTLYLIDLYAQRRLHRGALSPAARGRPAAARRRTTATSTPTPKRTHESRRHPHHAPRPTRPRPRRSSTATTTATTHGISVYVLVFVALMVLLVATVGAAYINMGHFNVPVAYAIAVAQGRADPLVLHAPEPADPADAGVRVRVVRVARAVPDHDRRLRQPDMRTSTGPTR